MGEDSQGLMIVVVVAVVVETIVGCCGCFVENCSRRWGDDHVIAALPSMITLVSRYPAVGRTCNYCNELLSSASSSFVCCPFLLLLRLLLLLLLEMEEELKEEEEEEEEEAITTIIIICIITRT